MSLVMQYDNPIMGTSNNSKDIEYKDTNVEAELDAINAHLSAIFPVGAVYLTVDDAFDPNDVFDGTWVKQDNDYYLATASTGGTKTAATNVGDTTLTAAQSGVPAHSHSVSAFTSNFDYDPNDTAGYAGIRLGSQSFPGAAMTIKAHNTNNNTAKNASQAHTHTMGKPATITVIMWVRTA